MQASVRVRQEPRESIRTSIALCPMASSFFGFIFVGLTNIRRKMAACRDENGPEGLGGARKAARSQLRHVCLHNSSGKGIRALTVEAYATGVQACRQRRFRTEPRTRPPRGRLLTGATVTYAETQACPRTCARPMMGFGLSEVGPCSSPVSNTAS